MFFLIHINPTPWDQWKIYFPYIYNKTSAKSTLRIPKDPPSGRLWTCIAGAILCPQNDAIFWRGKSKFLGYSNPMNELYLYHWCHEKNRSGYKQKTHNSQWQYLEKLNARRAHTIPIQCEETQIFWQKRQNSVEGRSAFLRVFVQGLWSLFLVWYKMIQVVLIWKMTKMTSQGSPI